MKVIGGSRGPIPAKRIELYNKIKKDIYDGIYSDRLPGMAKLAKNYNSCSSMIQIVMHELANDNIVEIRKKSGTYINYNMTKNTTAFIMITVEYNPYNDYNEFYQEYRDIEVGIKRCFKKTGEVYYFQIISSNNIEELSKIATQYNRIIIIYPRATQKIITEILKDKFYLRVMGVPSYSKNGGHITYDNEEIGTIAAKYLIGKNCKRFVYIGTDKLLLFKQRYESFAASLNYKNYPTECLYIDKTDMSLELLYMNLKNYFRANIEALKNRELGIFCGADFFLQAIKQELNLLGLLLTDVNIISCDNNQYHLRDIYPKCPVIDIRMEDIGYRAATIALFSNDCTIREAIIPTLLIPEN